MNEQVVAEAIKNEVLQEGGRFDHEKTRFDLLEPYAIEQLAKVFTFGARKYADNNWIQRPMDWNRMLASLHRHLNAMEQGQDYDPETGLLHMAHVAWNAMALVSYHKYHPEKDNRVIPKLIKEYEGEPE